MEKKTEGEIIGNLPKITDLHIGSKVYHPHWDRCSENTVVGLKRIYNGNILVNLCDGGDNHVDNAVNENSTSFLDRFGERHYTSLSEAREMQMELLKSEWKRVDDRIDKLMEDRRRILELMRG